MTTEQPSISVRFARRSTRGLLLGFTTPRVIALGLGAGLAILILFSLGPKMALYASVLWAPPIAAAFVRIAGKTVVEWAPTALHFGTRKALKQTEFKKRTTKPRPAGTLALPGDGACLRFHMDEATGAAMIHDPHRQTLSAVISVSHPAFVLLDETERTQRVNRWGRTLSQLAQSGHCSSVQVLEATIPDPVSGQLDWWEANGTDKEGFAGTQYRALLDQVRLDSSTHRTTLTVSLDMKAAARAIRAAGRGVHGAAQILKGDMASLTDSLRQAGLKPGKWLGEEELATMTRSVFDPRDHMGQDDGPAPSLAQAGPMAVSESWEWLRHDSAYSAVLWVSEWPRISVPPDFLHSLVFAPGVRRTLSLFARPVQTDDALRQIRREKTEAVADSAQKAKIGQLADLSDAQEFEDLMARERSVISGHTDVEFAGFVTVTAPSLNELDAAQSAISRAAAQATCEVRPLYGAQLQGFIAAALPLGRKPF